MTAVPPQRSGPDTDSVPITLARLEGKVDVALAQHGAKLADHDEDLRDHETRMRALEARPVVPQTVDERLKAVETKSTVSWKQLWSVVGAVGGLLTALQPYLHSLHP